MSHMDFNPAQKEAIETSTGPLLVLAGPGTGKTRVLIAKIEEVVRRGIEPNRILAITFSNKATAEMEERLLQRAPNLADRVEISTIHSWCQELTRREGFRIGFQLAPQLMTESQAQLFFRDLSHKLPLDYFVKTASVDAVLSELLSLLGRCKDEGLWPEDLIRFGQNTSNEEWEKLGDLYSAYQTFCLGRGFMDFGDVILFALRLLQDHEAIRQKIQESYDVILVDEFQDTNWSQVQLLKLITSPTTHICVVGDDDQAIYRFRGASYSAFQYFEAAFPSLKVVELTQTYRLSPQIANVASTLIQANGEHRFRPEKKIESISESGDPTKVWEFASHEDEAAATADAIRDSIAQGTLPGDIGVLGRSHRSLELLCLELDRRHIPYQSSAGEALFERPIIQDVLAILRLIYDPTSAVDLVRLLDSPFLQMGEAEIFRFCKEASAQSKPWTEFLQDFKSENAALKKFSENLISLKAHAYRRPLSETLFEIWQKTEIVQKLLGHQNDDLEVLARFHSHIFEWEKNQERKDAISLLRQLESLFRNETSFENTWEKSQEKVSLMTVHASKGLEFEHVYIMGLVGRRFPANFQQPTWSIPEGLSREPALTKDSHREEERRLLYVAVTRAKRRLTLTTVDKKGTKPSLFISTDLKPLLQDPKIIQWSKIPERPAHEKLLAPAPKPFGRSKPSGISARSDKPLHLSFTQIDRFDRCPRAYFFAHELKIPTPPSPSLAFGSAAHTALEKFFKEVVKTEAPSKESLLKDFDTALDHESLMNPQIPTERIRETGRQQLAAFYDWHKGDFPKPAAIEEKFKIKIGHHFLSGKIDRVDPSPEGMIIVDYKTGKPKSSDDDDHREFAEQSLQFSIYALAAKEFFKWPVKELKFHYLADNAQLATTRTQTQIEETKKTIETIASQIQQGNFEPKPNQMVCRNCEYKSICPSAMA